MDVIAWIVLSIIAVRIAKGLFSNWAIVTGMSILGIFGAGVLAFAILSLLGLTASTVAGLTLGFGTFIVLPFAPFFLLGGYCEINGIVDDSEALRREHDQLKADILEQRLMVEQVVSRREYQELKAKQEELKAKQDELKAENEKLKADIEAKQLREKPISPREHEEMKAGLTRVYEQQEAKHPITDAKSSVK